MIALKPDPCQICRLILWLRALHSFDNLIFINRLGYQKRKGQSVDYLSRKLK